MRAWHCGAPSRHGLKVRCEWRVARRGLVSQCRRECPAAVARTQSSECVNAWTSGSTAYLPAADSAAGTCSRSASSGPSNTSINAGTARLPNRPRAYVAFSTIPGSSLFRLCIMSSTETGCVIIPLGQGFTAHPAPHKFPYEGMAQ